MTWRGEAIDMVVQDDLPVEPVRTSDSVERRGGTFARATSQPHPPDDEGRDIDLGEDVDPELWGAQRHLIEEDEGEGLRLEGFDEDAIPRILNAMGDDAAEALQEYPEGTSATGSVDLPEHGGFPERD